MKTLLTFTLSLLSLTVFSATPSFSSFDTNNFSTSGNKITITNVPYSAVSGAPSNILVVTNLSGNAVVQSTLPFIFPGGLNPIGYNEIRVGGTNYPNFDTAAIVAISGNLPVFLSAGNFPVTNSITNRISVIGVGDVSRLINYCTNGFPSGTAMFVLTNNSYFANLFVVFPLSITNLQTAFGGPVSGSSQAQNVTLFNISTTNSGSSILSTVGLTADSTITVLNPNWIHFGTGISVSGGTLTIKGGSITGIHGPEDTTGNTYNISSSGNSTIDLVNVSFVANNTNSLNLNTPSTGQKLRMVACTFQNTNNGVLAQTNILVKTVTAGYCKAISCDFSAGLSGIFFLSGSTLFGKQISPDLFNSRAITAAGTATTTNMCGGMVVLSAGSSSYFITNNLVSANSAVVTSIASGDVTATSVTCSNSAGLITLTPNAAPTANVKISWMLLNPLQ